MTTATLYFLKSGIALAVFYGLYWIVMRNGTHFKLNRFILLSSLVLSFLLPLLSFGFLQKVEPALPSFTIVFDDSQGQSEGNHLTATSTAYGWPLWKIIYLAGCAFVFARLVYQAIYIRAISQMSKKITFQGITVILVSSEITPFSYMNRIFIPDGKYTDHALTSVIEHERSHLKQYHLLDILMIEMAIAFQWFNPFVWFYERSLKEIHEYLADDAVLKKGIPQGNYQALLVNEAIGGPVFTMSNQFNQSLIKKRIVMMTKMKTSGKSQLKALLFVPVIAVLIMAFAYPQKISKSVSNRSFENSKPVSSSVQGQPQEFIVTGTITEKATGEPLPGVNVVIEGTTTGTQTDNMGNYSIKAEGSNAVLVFSFIGYKTQKRIVVGNINNSDVQLETYGYTIDFSKGNQLVGEKKENEKEKTETPQKDKNLFVVVEEYPSFPGGTNALQKFIKSNLKYPEEAVKAKIEGTVMVSFMISAKGKVGDVKVYEGVNNLLSMEAFRIASLIPDWNPGHQNGKAVRFMVNVPIEFKLK